MTYNPFINDTKIVIVYPSHKCSIISYDSTHTSQMNNNLILLRIESGRYKYLQDFSDKKTEQINPFSWLITQHLAQNLVQNAIDNASCSTLWIYIIICIPCDVMCTFFNFIYNTCGRRRFVIFIFFFNFISYMFIRWIYMVSGRVKFFSYTQSVTLCQ